MEIPPLRRKFYLDPRRWCPRNSPCKSANHGNQRLRFLICPRLILDLPTPGSCLEASWVKRLMVLDERGLEWIKGKSLLDFSREGSSIDLFSFSDGVCSTIFQSILMNRPTDNPPALRLVVPSALQPVISTVHHHLQIPKLSVTHQPLHHFTSHGISNQPRQGRMFMTSQSPPRIRAPWAVVDPSEVERTKGRVGKLSLLPRK